MLGTGGVLDPQLVAPGPKRPEYGRGRGDSGPLPLPHRGVGAVPLGTRGADLDLRPDQLARGGDHRGARVAADVDDDDTGGVGRLLWRWHVHVLSSSLRRRRYWTGNDRWPRRRRRRR